MSLEQIEAELENLTPDELRHLALRSWRTFVMKEGAVDNTCIEDDPRLLSALDEAIAAADSNKGQGHSAAEVRSRLDRWTSK
jgi:hypothetical protein